MQWSNYLSVAMNYSSWSKGWGGVIRLKKGDRIIFYRDSLTMVVAGAVAWSTAVR